MDDTLAAAAVRAEDNDPIEALRALAELRRRSDRLEAVAVRRARVHGLLWSEIAAALGVSKQAVHKKYGGRRLLPGDN